MAHNALTELDGGFPIQQLDFAPVRASARAWAESFADFGDLCGAERSAFVERLTTKLVEQVADVMVDVFSPKGP